MPAILRENSLITVNLLTLSGKGECQQTLNGLRRVILPNSGGQKAAGDFARTGRSRNYEDRYETAPYQGNMTAILTGKHAIFELTQPLKTA